MEHWFKPHPKFKLNKVSYSIKNLIKESSSLAKESNAFKKSIGIFLVEWLSESTYINVRTSGSTGQPKTIAIEKKHMVNSAFATGDYFALEEGNSALLCLSADFIAGKMMLIRALVLGLELDYINPTSNLADKIIGNYDFCAMVPLQVEASLSKLYFIKILIVGGAPMSQDLKQKIQELPTQVFETYGMTETITHIAVKRVNHGIEDYFNILPSIQISKDGRNCLVINAPKVSSKPITTNDVVKLHSETKFEWLGRYDNIINSGGIKLMPEKIEKKLSNIITSRFFVAGIPDEKLGKKLVLVVEGNLDIDLLQKKIKDVVALTRYEVPKKIVSLPEFEENNGKVLRNKIIKTILT